MYFNTKSGKKLVSIIVAISAFLVIEGTGVPLTASASSSSAASISSRASSSGISSRKGVVTASYLNARSGPSTGYSIIGGFSKGAAVTIIDESNGWYKVELSGSKTGWVSGDYVTVSGSSTNSNASSSTTGVVTATYLNARSGPGTGYSIIGGFSKGAAVTIIEESNGWYKVELSGSKTGWISGDYVTVSGSSTNSTNNNTSNNTSSQSKKIVITASILNARSSASTSGAILGTVKQNEVYTYTSVKDGWYLVKIPSGQSAYICGDYVKSFSSYAINGGSSYIWPVQSSSTITSYFGPRNGTNHYGIDISASAGSQIIAAASGKVITKSYDANGYGYYIVVQQNDGICAYYAHMKSASFLSVGDTVNAGDTVGMVGATGNASGNHLHLEFRKGSTKINPLTYYPNIK